MENEVTPIIEEAWEERKNVLLKKIAGAAHQMENLLTLDHFYREGHKKEMLSKSLGEFGNQSLDTGAMADLLGEPDNLRLMDANRLSRIKKIHQQLKQIQAPTPFIIPFHEETSKILAQAEDRLNSSAQIFRLIRLAAMEARAKYQPALHDEFFSHFDWNHLDESEIALCPPIVVWSEAGEISESYFAKLLSLLADGQPLKLFFLQSEFSQARLGKANMELLPLTFNKVYFLQTACMNSNLAPHLAKGLQSPRPGVFFVFWKNTRDESFKLKAEKALFSRTRPHVVYDPDASSDFVTRLDLSANPENTQIWPMRALSYRTEAGNNETLLREFTTADFIAEENLFPDQFRILSDKQSEEKTLLLSDYLRRNPGERIGKTPYIYSVDKNKHLIRLQPSPIIVDETSNRMQLWRSLQELAGIDHPFIKAYERKLKTELTAEKERSLQQMKTELESELVAHQKEAVVSAMKNLALRLAGQPLSSIPSPLPIAPVVPVTKNEEPKEEKAIANDDPWLETKLCTTCDECTSINKNIFVYNKDKKAYIKNPKGGPFRDIVKAAEKCSAKIIHPGKPLDPNEKDLDKWIKRAEKFQ